MEIHLIDLSSFWGVLYNDIKNTTDTGLKFNVKVEYKRERRKVVAIKFKMWRIVQIPQKEALQGQRTTSDNELPQIVVELQQVGMQKNEAMHVYNQGFNMVNPEKCDRTDDFEGYVREKIHLLNSQPEGKIKNRIGFLIEAIKENYTNAQFEQQKRTRTREANKLKLLKLDQQKNEILGQRRKAVHDICEEIIKEHPHIVEEVLSALLESKPAYKRWYDSNKSAQENYHSSVPLSSNVDTQLMEKYPDKFETIQQEFQQKMTDIDQEIEKLRGKRAG